MTWPLVKFVDSPSTTANIRLDLSRSNVRVLNEGFDLGHPSFDGDPNSFGVDYGYRQIMMRVQVADTETVAFAEVQKIAREMLRSRNWLLVQTNPLTQPVWFKTYRREPGDLDYHEGGADVWNIEVPLVAEGFAFGALEVQAMQAINNDPAAASLACFAQLPTIKGDAPAAAKIRLRYTNAQNGYRHMLSTSPVSSTYTAPIVWPVGGTDGWTAGTDTGASAADAAMSGSNYRAVSFATQTALTNRLTGNVPVAVPPGRYKVLLRVARSDTSSTFSFRMGVAVGFAYSYGQTVSTTWGASTATKHAAWIDLGDFQIPTGTSLEDMSGEPSVTPDIALQVGRLTGSGACWLDAFLLVPVGDEYARTMFVDYANLGPAAVFHDEYSDADEEAVFVRDNTTGKIVSMVPPQICGGFHLVAPGVNNVVHFVEQAALDRAAIGSGDVPDRIGTDAQMVVSYYPRILHVAA